MLLSVLAAGLAVSSPASAQDPYGYRSEFLWEFPLTRGIIEAQIGEAQQNQLRIPELGGGWRAQQAWNAAHPLMAIPEVPAAPFEGASVGANSRVVADLASENRFAAWVKVSAWLLKADRFDYKRNALTKDKLVGKDFGNFNAGALSEIMGVPRPWFDFLADRVQNYQNAKYWVRGTSEQPFWSIFKGDESRGHKYVQLGRDWAVANSYRSFLSSLPELPVQTELWPKTALPVLPVDTRPDDLGLGRERPFKPDPDWWYKERPEGSPPETRPEPPPPPDPPSTGEPGPIFHPWG